MSFAWAIALAAAVGASAQEFPARSIHIFSGSPGGTADFSLRLIAQGLASSLGQPVIIENRGGIIDVRAVQVAKSQPDGYTLIYTTGALWLAPYLRDNVPFDPIRDYTPITLTSTAPNVLVVHPSLPVKNVKELIALVKAHPGTINYAVGQIASATHLAGELFKEMAGIDMAVVAYKGSVPQLTAVASGEVPVTFATLAVEPFLKSGRLKALAVTSAKPSSLAPGIPTVAEAGVPGYQMDVIYGLLGPAKLPEAVVGRLNREIVRVLAQPDVRQKYLDSGVEVVGSTPIELGAAIKREMTTLGKVIKDTGMHE
jgi:tripartite-type tricarboxylate transporter receptor subunit TctC